MGITADMVKRLREKTGAGMMDCKKALAETNADEEKAVEFLRQKGLASARKKESREAKEGTIGSYVHAGGKIGVMVEVNCETDFVARTPGFQEFARNLAMQVAAASPLYIRREDVPDEVVAGEKAIFEEQARQAGKPDKVVEKIAEGKVDKYYSDVCLLEQAYVKDQNMTVEDLLQEIRGKVGENVQVRRFVRFQLGE
ncbi:MAG: translation elongation factor Ts [Myxococcota bacterium]